MSIFSAPTSRQSEFLITKWTTEQGLPQNTVTAIVQTSDGYIWLGTFGGLARFDGIRFTSFDATNTPNFQKNRILSLHGNPHGGLWVGTDSGEVYIIRGDRLEEFASGLDFDRKAVWGIEQDALGNLYISSTDGIEVFSLDEAGWPVAGSGRVLSYGEAYNLYKDRNGRVWAKFNGDIALVSDSTLTPISSLGYAMPLSVHDLTFDADGQLFVAASASLGEVSPQRYREILTLDSATLRTGSAIASVDERILFQQANVLYEISDSEITAHDLGDYVQSGSRIIFEDREDNMWLATQTEGLIRIEQKRVGSMASILGEGLRGVFSVAQGTDGTVWFAGKKLTGVNGGDVRKIDSVVNGSPFPLLKSLAVAPDKQLWAGGMVGLYQVVDDQLLPVPGFADRHVQSLFFDKHGDLLVGTETGLIIRQGESMKVFDRTTGLPSNVVHSMTQAKDGTIWIGTGSGIARLDGETLELIPNETYFGDDAVRDIVEAEDGSLWIGTYGGGLKRFNNGKVATITRSNGLPNNFISRILVADDGKFWISTNHGIYVISREELENVADGEVNLLGGAVFGVGDGMTSSEANGGHQPAGIKTADGRLWFIMLDDLVWIDPKNIVGPRPVAVIENAVSREGVEQENKVSLNFDASSPLEIENGVRNLEIEYTGLSFKKPEAIRFVYKLEGLDSDWINAGGRRTAFYPYLPAGNYHFQVRAVSADGLWSDVAGVKISVAEKFWETRWFASLVFVFALGLIGLLFWSRLRYLKKRQIEKTEFARQLIIAGEQERRRIATDLHDGLTQNLLLIKNWAGIAIQKIAQASEQSVNYLEKIGSVAGESIDETRTIIENLGPRNLNQFGLTEAIINITDQVQDAFGIVFEMDIENIDGLLDEESELSVYRMTQECINNIVKHSESPRGRIDIKKTPSFVQIAITDFGIGIGNNGNIGGNGLRNLEERAEILNGEVEIDSKPDEGTTVTITVPYSK